MSDKLNIAIVLLAIMVAVILTNWRINILEDAFDQYKWEHRSTTVGSVEGGRNEMAR